MKKALKIIGICLVVFLAVLLILPFAFKGKIVEIAKSEGNKMLNAKFDFSSLNLSFIKNFPQATVTLNDFYLVGINEFEGDTLVSVKQFNATVNIMSIIRQEQFEVGKILLSEPKIYAKVLTDGKANWDVMKDSGETENTVAETGESSNFQLSLKKLTIEKANIIFDDKQGNMLARVNDFNLGLQGDLSSEKTKLSTDFSIGKLSLTIGNIPYLINGNIEAKINVDADLKNKIFTLEDNDIRLNAIKTSMDGWVKLPEEGYEMDMSLNTSKVEFKDILSLIPAINAKEFKDIQTSGNVTLAATAKGTMKDDILPALDIKLNIDNAMFKYPSLPKAVNDIQIKAEITNPGGSADRTSINIEKLHFNMAGNPFDMYLKLNTPVSDPDIQAKATGKIDLGMIKEVYPLEGTALQGVLDANLEVKGRYSYVEKEQYDKFIADGSLNLKSMQIKSDSFPLITIQNMLMKFSPQYVNLSETNIQVGKSDFKINGNLENMLGYALKGDVLKGKLSVTSNYLDLNEFMTDTSEVEETSSMDSTAAVFEVPRNINFDLNASFEKIIFQKLVLNQSKGNLHIADGKISINNMTTKALNGNMTINGYYSTAKSLEYPEVNFKLDMQNISFVETFKAFDMVQQLTPIFENITGDFSAKLDLNTALGKDMTPLLESLLADGQLSSQNISVSNVPALNSLAEALNNNSLKHISAKDVKIPFEIKDGRVFTDPFDINMGDIKMNLTGSTGLDQTINYTAKVNLPSSATSSLGGLISTANVKIGGTFANPEIKVDMQQAAKDVLDNLKGKAEDKLLNLLGSDNKNLNEELQAQKEKLLQDANSNAEKLVKEAESAGQKLIKEAENAGDKLVKEANNAIAKAAAQVAAKKLKYEAESQAKKLKAAAEEAGKKLIEEANAQSEKPEEDKTE